MDQKDEVDAVTVAGKDKNKSQEQQGNGNESGSLQDESERTKNHKGKGKIEHTRKGAVDVPKKAGHASGNTGVQEKKADKGKQREEHTIDEKCANVVARAPEQTEVPQTIEDKRLQQKKGKGKGASSSESPAPNKNLAVAAPASAASTSSTKAPQPTKHGGDRKKSAPLQSRPSNASSSTVVSTSKVVIPPPPATADTGGDTDTDGDDTDTTYHSAVCFSFSFHVFLSDAKVSAAGLTDCLRTDVTILGGSVFCLDRPDSGTLLGLLA